MKFYIASRYSKREYVNNIREMLNKKGHSMTFDWTKSDSFRPYGQNQENSKEVANKSLDGIKNSDIFILLTDEGGTDMYVELGIALVNFINKGNPKIYVLGEHLEKSIFYFHPSVNLIKSIEEIKEI